MAGLSRGVLGGSLMVLLGGAAVIAVAIGSRQSFGLFLLPMTESLGSGREVFALAIAIQNIVWGVTQPFFGAAADRWGAARVIAVSGLIYAGGLWMMGNTASEAELFLSTGLLIGLALSGTSFGVVLAAVGRAFPPQTRSLALGLVSAGGSFGQFAMIPLGQAFINAYGWAFALTLIALMAASMVLLAWTLAGDKGSQGNPGARASIPEALRCACAHSGFRWLNLGFFVCGFHITFIVSHLPAYLEDRGLSAEDGAIALSLIGLFNIIGSVICGFAGGRFAKKNVLSVMYFARSLVVLGLLMLPFGPMTAYVFAAAMGLLWLGTVPLTNGLVAQVFGPATVGTLFGVVFFSHQIGAFLGVWLGGYVFDSVGSYDMVWWIAIGLGVLAGIIHLPIDERPVVVAQTA